MPMFVLYKLVALISFLIRTYLLPELFNFTLEGMIFNLIAGVILHELSFSIVGIFYELNSFPALGSFLYLIFYYIHTKIFVFVQDKNLYIIFIVAFSYTVVYFLLKERLRKYRSDNLVKN